MLGSAFEDQLRAEVLALRSELRHARAQTNTLESKLVRATKRNPAPFGSSQPTIGTHAHFELHEGQQSPTGVSFGRSPPASIPARPRSAMADYSGASTRILSPSPESSSFTPNGRTQVPQPPTRSSSLQDQVEAGSPSTTPVHGKTLSRIPFAAVGAGRALAGIEHDGRRMSPRSPRSPPTLQHEEDMLAPVVGAVDLADHLAPAFVLNEAPVIPNGTSDPTASGEPSSGLTSATRHVHRSANSPLAASGAGSPFFGSSSTGDRHAARLLSSSTGTGRVLSSLQADLASLRTQLDSTKAQLRISQRAVESLGRQAEEARDARDRIRAEADATMARLTRRERQFEDLLSRAQRAEAELNASRERERDAVTHAKSLEAGTADAKKLVQFEPSLPMTHLPRPVSRMRDTWRGEATALREQFESLRTGYGKRFGRSKAKASNW